MFFTAKGIMVAFLVIGLVLTAPLARAQEASQSEWEGMCSSRCAHSCRRRLRRKSWGGAGWTFAWWRVRFGSGTPFEKTHDPSNSPSANVSSASWLSGTGLLER